MLKQEIFDTKDMEKMVAKYKKESTDEVSESRKEMENILKR